MAVMWQKGGGPARVTSAETSARGIRLSRAGGRSPRAQAPVETVSPEPAYIASISSACSASTTARRIFPVGVSSRSSGRGRMRTGADPAVLRERRDSPRRPPRSIRLDDRVARRRATCTSSPGTPCRRAHSATLSWWSSTTAVDVAGGRPPPPSRSQTYGDALRRLSISAGEISSPDAESSTCARRPTGTIRPSSSSRPRSPVRYQPSSSDGGVVAERADEEPRAADEQLTVRDRDLDRQGRAGRRRCPRRRAPAGWRRRLPSRPGRTARASAARAPRTT